MTVSTLTSRIRSPETAELSGTSLHDVFKLLYLRGARVRDPSWSYRRSRVEARLSSCTLNQLSACMPNLRSIMLTLVSKLLINDMFVELTAAQPSWLSCSATWLSGTSYAHCPNSVYGLSTDPLSSVERIIPCQQRYLRCTSNYDIAWLC